MVKSLKTCSRCRSTKLTTEFGVDNSRNDCLYPYCRECQRNNSREAQRRHREKTDPDGNRNRAQATAYYHQNKEACLERRVSWGKENPDKIAEIKRKWIAGRRARDPFFRLRSSIGARVRGVLAGRKGHRTFDLLGYTHDQLRAHVQNHFPSGMTWENYGEWHLDHIRPIAAFDFSDPDNVKKCWALENLQPLWGSANQLKSAMWDGQRWANGKPLCREERV